VVNLSTTELSNHHYTLLGRSLSFCPTPPTPKSANIQLEMENFHRRLRLIDHFHTDDPEDNERDIPTFRGKSSWTPPKNKNPLLDAYILANNTCTQFSTPTKNNHSNLSSDEWTALDELKTNSDIIIKPADKGGAVVIMNKTDYIST
jgi:hypothetical protein